MSAKQDEKNQKILRDLINKIPENKRCADCTAKGPVYANTTFNTFICTACSGIHREFNHRVKSISMASFKPEEVKGLVEGGNAVARQKWMARWTSQDHPEPDPGDPDKLRQFIRLKYLDQRWVASSSAPVKSGPKTHSSPAKKEEIPRAEPLTNILGNDIPPINVRPNPQTTQNSGWGFDSTPAPQQPQQNSNWAAFPAPTQQSTPTPTPQQTQSLWDAPVQSTGGGGMDNLLFPSTEQAQKLEQEKMHKMKEEEAKKKSQDLLMQLGSMYNQQAQTNVQQQQQMMMQQMQQMMMQMAQSGQMQGLTPQQQQMMMQQMQQQFMMQGMQGFTQPTQQFPPQTQQFPPQTFQTGAQSMPPVQTFPGQFTTQPYPVPQQTFGGSTGQFGGGLATSPGGGFGSIGQTPALPVEPAKPDPFAALSPFSMGAKSTAPPKKQTTAPVNDPFGFGTTSNPPPQQHQEVNPFGIQTSNPPPSNQQQQNDFNPFF